MASKITGMTLVAAVWVTGCGTQQTITATEVGSEEEAVRRSTDSFWHPLAPNLTEVTEAGSTIVRRCRFSVGTAIDRTVDPPLSFIWMRKEPVDESVADKCPDNGFVIIGQSYIVPTVLLAGRPHQPYVVAAFNFRLTPTEGPVLAEVIHIDFFSGAQLHATIISAASETGLGFVEPETLSISASGTVTLTGTKDGVIPGEVGSGSNFIAVFDKYVRNPVFDPPPSSVVAF